MKRKVLTIGIAVASFIGAGLFSYKLVTDEGFKEKLLRGAKDFYDTGKKKVDVMSEDVMVKKAQVTKNPKVNQDWVEKQWEAVL